MLPSTSRQPKILAFIHENNEIEWMLNNFRDLLELANGRHIKIVIVIGSYQIGKTSFISLISGNSGHQIGNGYDEETIGATFDGPFSASQISNRWNIPDYENIEFESDDAIFFVDIEGFGSYRRGNFVESQNFFTKLVAPLIAISSCVVLIANLNENSATLNQLISAFRFGDFCFRIGNENQSPVILNSLIKDIVVFNRINYSNPNIDNYNEISNLLTNHWQSKIQSNDFISIAKPLPRFEAHFDIFHQNEHFYNGFKLIVSDIVHTLMSPTNRINTNNVELLYNFFQNSIECINAFNFDSIRRLQQDFCLQALIENITNASHSMNPSVQNFINQYKSTQINLPLTTFIDLNEESIYEHLYNGYINMHDEVINERFNSHYFQIPEINNTIDDLHLNIGIEIHHQVSIIINDIKRSIRNKIRNSIVNINPSLSTFISQYLRRQKQKSLNDGIVIKKFNISTYLNVCYNQIIDGFLHQNVNSSYLQNQEINNLLFSIRSQIRNEINSNVPSIKRAIKTIIIMKVKSITTFINNEINKKISEAGVELLDRPVLEYKIVSKEEFFNVFHGGFIDIVNKSFDLNVPKCYQRIQEVISLKNRMISNMDEYIKSVAPRFIKEYKKKKKVQILAKAGIGIISGISFLAAFSGIGTVLGLATLGTVVSTEAGLTAAIGAGYGSVVLSMMGSGAAAGAIVGSLPAVEAGITAGLICGQSKNDFLLNENCHCDCNIYFENDSKEYSGEEDYEYSGEEHKEYNEEEDKEYSEEEDKEYSEEEDKEYSEEEDKEYSEEEDKEYSGEEHKEYNEEEDKEYSEEEDKEYSEEEDKEYSEEEDKECSEEEDKEFNEEKGHEYSEAEDK
ncbi:hypothetical protein M9Y10_024664 [Tritrichomonas musculus]|uniref:GB1/RHD3-type G domain-containing protein n=1 Tax=Tritrichomonas musculus TaxID=1915356 RepID=A0ABR2HAX7_9EUKA